MPWLSVPSVIVRPGVYMDASVCKSANTPNQSSMADHAITQRDIRGLGSRFYIFDSEISPGMFHYHCYFIFINVLIFQFVPVLPM